jgi:hypothetical protein
MVHPTKISDNGEWVQVRFPTLILADSYGYRPGESALDAVGVTRRDALNGAVGGPRLLEIDAAVTLPVRQPGRMHGERDDVERR